jgi:hypothetical protein
MRFIQHYSGGAIECTSEEGLHLTDSTFFGNSATVSRVCSRLGLLPSGSRFLQCLVALRSEDPRVCLVPLAGDWPLVTADSCCSPGAGCTLARHDQRVCLCLFCLLACMYRAASMTAGCKYAYAWAERYLFEPTVAVTTAEVGGRDWPLVTADSCCSPGAGCTLARHDQRVCLCLFCLLACMYRAAPMTAGCKYAYAWAERYPIEIVVG